jgi:hypothetical protein
MEGGPIFRRQSARSVGAKSVMAVCGARGGTRIGTSPLRNAFEACESPVGGDQPVVADSLAPSRRSSPGGVATCRPVRMSRELPAPLGDRARFSRKATWTLAGATKRSGLPGPDKCFNLEPHRTPPSPQPSCRRTIFSILPDSPFLGASLGTAGRSPVERWKGQPSTATPRRRLLLRPEGPISRRSGRTPRSERSGTSIAEGTVQ